jgi:hypothetical protein
VEDAVGKATYRCPSAWRGGAWDNWAADRRDYFVWPQAEIRLDRKRPGVGYRHVLTVPQLRKFIGELPDWDQIAVGLDAIVLGAGRDDAMGWYDPQGVVVLCAWPAHSGFWVESSVRWNEENEVRSSQVQAQAATTSGSRWFGLLLLDRCDWLDRVA